MKAGKFNLIAKISPFNSGHQLFMLNLLKNQPLIYERKLNDHIKSITEGLNDLGKLVGSASDIYFKK